MTTKKKVTKKTTAKKETALATSAALSEENLSVDALAKFANYDTTNFKDVELDVAENTELFANDFIVPKIWLMQEMSDLAKDKKRKDIESGDFVNSQSEEVLLKIDGEMKYLPIVVLKTFKRWQTFQTTEGGEPLERKRFVKSEVMKLGVNENYKYDFTEEGEKFVRRQVISAYVMLGEDAQQGINKPFVIDFAATSKEAGRMMISDIKVLNTKGLPSYVGWFKLSVAEETNKDGDDYFVKKMKFGGPMPEQMMPFLTDAYKEITTMIEANTIEIDDSDLVGEVSTKAKTSAKVSKKALGDEAGI